jgi:hypothetical protein
LDLQVTQLCNAVGLKTQLLNGHSHRATLNPRGDTGDFGGGDAGFVAPERLVHKMILQRGHAVLQEKPVLRFCAAAQFDLAVKESGFDGIVQSLGEAELRLAINKLSCVCGNIDFSGHAQIGGGIEQDSDIEKLLDVLFESQAPAHCEPVIINTPFITPGLP